MRRARSTCVHMALPCHTGYGTLLANVRAQGHDMLHTKLRTYEGREDMWQQARPCMEARGDGEGLPPMPGQVATQLTEAERATLRDCPPGCAESACRAVRRTSGTPPTCVDTTSSPAAAASTSAMQNASVSEVFRKTQPRASTRGTCRPKPLGAQLKQAALFVLLAALFP